LGPIPNPQSPIPIKNKKPKYKRLIKKLINKKNINLLKNCK